VLCINPRGDIWAVVPVKAFNLAKQRLAPVYAPKLRHELARVMLEDVLDTLTHVEGLAGIAVVTADPEAAELARRHGTVVFDEAAGGGLNEAVAAAARRLAGEYRAGMLAVAGDLPRITVYEVEALLAFHGRRRGLTLVPAHDHEGTNALVMTPPDAMPPSFGVGSFARHLLGGHAAGLEPLALPLPNIGLDLDRPQDVAFFARIPSPTRTWRYLQSQGLVTPREPETVT
jgi:2-phospho-L-lactate guanylyltransferase